MSAPPCIWWVRQDLRLEDNPALHAAIQTGGAVIPVFVWAPDEERGWPPGGASKLWLHDSLRVLDDELRACGSRLVLRLGPSKESLMNLLRETGALSVYWNRRYEPAITERDREVKDTLQAMGVEAKSFNGLLLREPWTIENKSGKAFQVFSAFWRRSLEGLAAEPVSPSPTSLGRVPPSVKSLPLAALELDPGHTWTHSIRAAWVSGTAGAKQELARFLGEGGFAGYDEGRNRPDLNGTSRLSPYLHFGQVTPRQVWEALGRHARKAGIPDAAWRRSQFAAELGWREFAYHLLYHFPHTPEEPLRPEFRGFSWRSQTAGLKAWTRGRTGVPLVDAGMRQLWATGWMHNRVRMVVASFLVKNLRVHWREGAKWFWDTLVDSDLASNTLGWQWTAGCGADAAPYFRIFNPVSQAEKFDPNGDYIRRWVPELRALPARWIGCPWQAPASVLEAARVELGRTYPEPVVSLMASREEALAAYEAMRANRRNLAQV